MKAEEALPFWPSPGKGATAEEVTAAEKYVGHTLPPSLRDLLLERDGGVSNFEAYEKGEVYFPLLPILGVNAAAGTGTLMRAHDVRNTFGVPEGVVVFAAQGHAWLGLDYRADPAAPSVVYRNDEESPVEFVVSSFDAFLRGLTQE